MTEIIDFTLLPVPPPPTPPIVIYQAKVRNNGIIKMVLLMGTVAVGLTVLFIIQKRKNEERKVD